MHRKIKTHNTALDMCLVHRWLLKKAKEDYNLNPSEIEVIIAINRLTSGNLGNCIVSDMEILLTGATLRDPYKWIRGLIKRDIVYNSGKKAYKKKFYLGLTDQGQAIARSLHASIKERMRYLNDKLKLKQQAVKALANSKGRWKGNPALRIKGYYNKDNNVLGESLGLGVGPENEGEKDE